MYHFFVTPAQIMDGYAAITGQDVNHIRNVLRMKAGEQVGIRDGRQQPIRKQDLR